MTKAIHDIVMEIMSQRIESADRKIDASKIWAVDQEIYRNEANILRNIRDEMKDAIKKELKRMHDSRPSK